MTRKSNMKVSNSSTHLVKGCNPYCSWCILSVKTDRKCIFLWFCTANLNKIIKTTARSWEMQFLTDKLIVFPSHSEDPKIHKPSQTPLSFHRLSRPWKAYPIFPKHSKTFKDCAHPVISPCCEQTRAHTHREAESTNSIEHGEPMVSK